MRNIVKESDKVNNMTQEIQPIISSLVKTTKNDTQSVDYLSYQIAVEQHGKFTEIRLMKNGVKIFACTPEFYSAASVIASYILRQEGLIKFQRADVGERRSL